MRLSSLSRKSCVQAAATALAAGLALSACGTATPSGAGGSGTSAGSSSSGGSGSVLTAATNGSGPWSPVFNPFSPSYNYAFGFGAVYESLYMFNDATNKNIPWLATSFKWSGGGKTITFGIRKGVKWSNGKPFTPADVAFTFKLENKINAENNATSGNAAVAVHGDEVSLTYGTPQYVNFDQIAFNTPIVPPFTFAKVGDPLKFEDSHPIGTGPYLLKSETPQYITYTKNPHYWQKGKPTIQTVRDVSADSNSTMEALLIAHKIQYSGVFTSDIKRTFADRAPSQNVVYTPALGTISLALNLSNPMFQSVALRRGISEAIDRTQLSNIGESGAEPPASPTGLAGSVAQRAIESKWAKPISQNVSAALATLKQGGYSYAGGKLTAHGSSQQVAFSLEYPSSYSDWMTDCQLLQSDMSKIGVKVSCDGVSYQRFTADTSTGKYAATFDTSTGPNPYQELNQVFAVGAKGLPKVGQSNNNENIERFDDPTAVKALGALATTNPSDTAATQKQEDILEQIMVQQVPVIPLFASTYHADFVNGPLTGWPSNSNPYLCVACYAAQEQLLLNAH